MKWVKGHNGIQGNKGSDALAKQGANKWNPDPLDLAIPRDFDIPGAKLPTLTQATVYKGILERRKSEPHNTTEKNLKLTHRAIKRITGNSEMNAAIWQSTQRKAIRPIIQQFLYKTIYSTHLIGKYWRNINSYKDQEICASCNKTESMSHIITQCKEKSTQLIWDLTKNFWPHRNIPWPEIDLGTILSCGCINVHPVGPTRNNQRRRKKTTHRGPTQLLQILLSESVYLIWVLRCKRVIQEKTIMEREISTRWHCTINERLTINEVTAMKLIQNHKYTELIKGTWELAMKKTRGTLAHQPCQSECYGQVTMSFSCLSSEVSGQRYFPNRKLTRRLD